MGDRLLQRCTSGGTSLSKYYLLFDDAKLRTFLLTATNTPSFLLKLGYLLILVNVCAGAQAKIERLCAKTAANHNAVDSKIDAAVGMAFEKAPERRQQG